MLVSENIATRRKKKLEQGREENKMKGCVERNANKHKLWVTQIDRVIFT